MIDTDSVTHLFVLFAEDLRESGFEPESTEEDLTALLSRLKAPPSEPPTHTLQLDFTLQEFTTALQALGADAQFMWPGSTVESAGLRLLLTHVDEQRATRWTGDGPGRMSRGDAQVALSSI